MVPYRIAMSMLCLGCGLFCFSGFAAQRFALKHVWPISGTELPDGPLASPFGPRLKASEAYRYDFHRGIDIPSDIGTPVRAVADGTVRIGGEHPGYKDGIVQIRHAGVGGGVYYSNYMHISESLVEEGQVVERGEVIARTGASESGYAHLHFEIRAGGLYQKDCINPFSVLPYADANSPEVVIDFVELSQPGAPVVQATVRLPRITPDAELDFNRIEIVTYRKNGKKLTALDAQAFDMEVWNALYTPKNDPNAYLDDPDFNGVFVRPGVFNAASDRYEISFTFRALQGPDNPKHLVVEALARDVKGNVTVVRHPETSERTGGRRDTRAASSPESDTRSGCTRGRYVEGQSGTASTQETPQCTLEF